MKSLNFVSTILIVAATCLGVGCTASYYDYPDAWKFYSKNGVKARNNHKLEIQVQKDMLECGFSDVSNPREMSREREAEAQICMAKKNYKWSLAKKNQICDFWQFKDTETCKKHRGEQ